MGEEVSYFCRVNHTELPFFFVSDYSFFYTFYTRIELITGFSECKFCDNIK